MPPTNKCPTTYNPHPPPVIPAPPPAVMPGSIGHPASFAFGLPPSPISRMKREIGRGQGEGEKKSRRRKDTGSPLKITPPLRGSRRSQAARRRLRRWGAQGHPRRWPRHPHLHPLPSRERKRRERAGGHAGPPLQEPSPPTSCCHARLDRASSVFGLSPSLISRMKREIGRGLG